MRGRVAASIAGLAVAVWAVVQAPSPPTGLARYLPQGALLVLEASDFGSLVKDWNGSGEKKTWVGGANFKVFSQSRLYLRLADAQSEFAAAASLAPHMALLEAVAGGESALALYDIGKLEFLYITRLESARALETVLWRTRSTYETRDSAGTPYFVRVDAASRRVAAFAVRGDLLLLATSEDAIAGALALLAEKPGATVKDERWYAETARAAGPAGELRLTMNLAVLARNPYFRSYWIQRNVPEVRQFTAAVADMRRSAGQIREDRVLLRSDATAAPAVAEGAMGRALSLVPAQAGFYRAWASPAATGAVRLLASRILEPSGATTAEPLTAPEVASYGGAVGSEADLETRIDEAAVDDAELRPSMQVLSGVLAGARLEAMLDVGATRVLADKVLVAIDSVVVLVGAADWNVQAVRAALAAATPEFGPPGRIVFATEGKVLMVGNSAELLGRVRAQLGRPAAQQVAAYVAQFRHGQERQNFLRMARLIDTPLAAEQRRAGQREPRFFSENIVSLGQTLGRVQTESIAVRDTGTAVYETVTYEMKP